MKQSNGGETLFASLVGILCFGLLAPWFFDHAAAQNELIVSHHPIKMGYRGKPLNVVAYIASDVAVKQVSLSITSGEQSMRGRMPKIAEAGELPVLLELKKTTALYAGPGSNYSKVAELSKGETVLYTGTSGGFYRVRTTNEVAGFVHPNDLRILKTGFRYGVAIPPNFTQLGTVSYQVKATDILGGVTELPVITARLLTEDQIAQLQTAKGRVSTPSSGSGRMASGDRKGGPFFAKPWFWLVSAAVGGAAYYYLTLDNDQVAKESVNVSVTWK